MAINKANKIDFSKKEENLLRKIDIKGKGPGGKTWYDLSLQELKDFDGYIERFILAMISKLKLKDSCSLFLDGKFGNSERTKHALFFKMSENFMFTDDFLALYKSLYNHLMKIDSQKVGMQVSNQVYRESLSKSFKDAGLRLDVDFKDINEVKFDEINFDKLITKRAVEEVKKAVEVIIEVEKPKKVTRVKKVVLPSESTDESKKIVAIKVEKKHVSLEKLEEIKSFTDEVDFMDFYRNEIMGFMDIDDHIYFTNMLKIFIKLDIPSSKASIIKKSILRAKPNYKFTNVEKKYFEEDIIIEEKTVEEIIEESVIDFEEIKQAVSTINQKEKPTTSSKYKGALAKKLDTIKKYSNIDEFLKFYIKERPNFSSKKNVKYFVAILDKFIELKYDGKFFETIKARILKLEKDYNFSDKQKEYFKLLESGEDIETSVDEKVVNFDEIRQAVEVIEKREGANVEMKESNEVSANSIDELQKSSIDDLLNKILEISSDEELISTIRLIKDLEINNLNELFEEISKDFSKYNEIIIKYLLDKKGQQKDIKSIQKIITYLDIIKSDYSGWIKKYKEVLGDNLLIINNKEESIDVEEKIEKNKDVKEIEVIKEVEVIREVEKIKEIEIEVVKNVEKIIEINKIDEKEIEVINKIYNLNDLESARLLFGDIEIFSKKIIVAYIKKISFLGGYKDIYNLNKMFTTKISEELYQKSLLNALENAPNGKAKLKFMIKKLNIK